MPAGSALLFGNVLAAGQTVAVSGGGVLAKLCMLHAAPLATPHLLLRCPTLRRSRRCGEELRMLLCAVEQRSANA